MLEGIRQNIEKLVALYEGQKAESERLSAELSGCRQAMEALKGKNTELERQVDTLRLSQAFNSADSHDARQRIEKLIKQIDKCIAQLER